MKSFQDLYDEIIKSDDLKKTFVEAMKENRVIDFLRERGCEGTVEEIREFLLEKAVEDKPLELSMERLKEVAGGVESILSQPCTISDTCAFECC